VRLLLSQFLLVLLFGISHPHLSLAEQGSASLKGTVLSESGMPAHATVTAYRLVVADGRVVPQRACAVESNEDGKFECARLDGGDYVLSIIPEAAETSHNLVSVQENGIDTKFGSFYIFPSPVGGSIVYFIQVGTGASQSVQVNLEFDPSTKIAFDWGSGSSPHWCQVNWLDQNPRFSFKLPTYEGVCSDKANEDLGVPFGMYSILESWSVANVRMSATRTVPSQVFPSRSTSSSLEVPVRMVGVVGISSEYDAEKWQKKVSSARVVLHRIVGSAEQEWAAPLDSAGHFDFGAIDSGTYEVYLRGVQGLYVESIFGNGRGETSNLVTIPANGGTVAYEVVTGRTSASIVGTAEIAQDARKPSVLLHQLDGREDYLLQVDDAGHFQAVDIVPGRYRIYAWNDIAQIPYRDERFLDSCKSQAQDVDFSDDTHMVGIVITPADCRFQQ
jgi:hypothetical protein